jgi:peptidoglycan/LPS O-acetylase OafA/YrhL
VRSLDGVRGVGAVAVICAHYFGFLACGYYSMDVFFALSGFLITTLLLEERDKTGGVVLLSFYRRRAYRLLPGLFTVLAVYAILTSASALALEQIAGGGLYASNIVMASGSHLLVGTPLTAFWSLAQEEQFYLLWPIVLVLLLKRGVRESRIAGLLIGLAIVLAVYAAGLALAGASPTRIYDGPDTHAGGLLLGCAFAVLRRRGVRISQPLGWVGLATLVGCSVLAPTTSSPAFVIPLIAIAATVFVGSVLEPGLLARCFSWRPLVWLGVISYSLYLWHSVVFWLLGWRNPLVALPITLAVSTLSYYKVERPLRKGFRAKSVEGVKTQPVPGFARSRHTAEDGRVPTWVPRGVFAMLFSER